MSNAFFTIDTDNAIIRLYTKRCDDAGLSITSLAQLQRDLNAVALGVSFTTGATFRVVVVS